MREAKAEYYEALAGLKNADAEYRQAQARYQDACTKLEEAAVKAQELQNAAQELTNAKNKAFNEADIAERKAQCEAALVAWQKTITDNQKALAQAEYELQDKLREIAALSMGLTETEKSVLNAAISGYEDAIKKYNEAVAALYCAQFDLYEAQYDKAAGIGDTDYDDEEVEYAESYEDSVVFYEAVEAYYAEKLAEYVFTDDPAVWKAELEEIADSIATWEYNANIIDADMAKKFANEYYDGVKAWNEAYAAYVEANEPQKDPNLKAPDGYLFHKDGKSADYTKQLPVHTPATDKFVSHFNSYLMEWCDYVKRWRWTVPVEKAYIYTEKKGAEDVFVVEDLRIDNYDLFLNGNPDDKDVLGLNGILETLERDLVLQGDATTVAKLKEEKEAAEKAFNTADSIVRAGLMAYIADTLDRYKEAVAGMHNEAKVIADAQAALVKAVADYAKGLGQHSYFTYNNPIASYADSVALFNAIKNFAKARADYFGDGSILAKYYDIPEITGKTAPEIAAEIVYYLNTLPYYTYDGSFTAKKDSVNLEDIVFSGFQQSAVYPNSFIALVPEPWHIKSSDINYAVEMYFNSLYGGEGLAIDGPSHPTFKSPVWYPGYKVNMNGVTTPDSTKWWAAAYYLGQQIPAMHAKEDAFIKAVAKIYLSGFDVDDFGGFDDDPVEFWADIYDAYEEASMTPAALAEYTSKVGLYGAQTKIGADKNLHVMIDGEEVVSQEVLKLAASVKKNIYDYIKIYNQYWGEDTNPEHSDFLSLVQNWKFYDKDGKEIHISPISDVEDIITKIASIKEVDGQVYSYHWSVKTFTEPYNIVNFEKALSDKVVYVVDSKELEIVFDNLPIEYSVRVNAFLTAIFNGSKDMTLLAKMLYAEDQYAMYANAKDAIEIVKQLKGVDAEVKAAAAEVTKAYEAYYTALSGYGQDYVTFYKTLTGDVKGADDTVKANTTDGVVNWDAVVAALYTTVHNVMTKANENYILNQIKDDQWTVKGEMKAMAEKFLPTYPADFHAAKQLKGHSQEMINLYEVLYYALDKTYLTAVQMKDPELIGKVVERTAGQGKHQRTETYVVEPRTFKQAYENLIDNCSSAIEYCENKIAFFEKMIALVEAGFGPVDARISALEAQVEYYTQKLVDAQVQLDVAKAKYDEAVAAYAE